MLCLRTIPKHTHLPITVTLLRRRTAAVRMSTGTGSNQIVEHFVLFKVKPTVDPTPMLTNLNSLTSLPTVLDLSAVPVTRCSTSGPLSFTHILHSRYRSIPDLQSYSDDPTHVAVVTDYVRPSIDDAMAVDFVAEEGFDMSNPKLPPGSELRLTCVKLKEGVGEEGKTEVLDAMKGVKGKLQGFGIEEMTVGENFSPARAKGFGICSLAVLKGGGLEKLNDQSVGEIMNKEKDKIVQFVDQILVVDCVVGDGISSSSL